MTKASCCLVKVVVPRLFQDWQRTQLNLVLCPESPVYGQLRTRFCGSVFSGNCKVRGDRFLGQHTSGAFHIPTPSQVRLVGADLTEYIELLLPRLRVRRSSFSGPVGLAGEVVHSKVRSQRHLASTKIELN